MCNIRSEQQFNSIKSVVKTLLGNYASVFVGTNDMETEGVWKLSNGEPFELEGEWINFNDYGGNQDCAAIDADYDYFHDQECFEERYFICEFLN